jgi:hypothetical protein
MWRADMRLLKLDVMTLSPVEVTGHIVWSAPNCVGEDRHSRNVFFAIEKSEFAILSGLCRGPAGVATIRALAATAPLDL